MAAVPEHNVVSDDYRGPDRRRNGPLGRFERGLISVIRSRWTAAFVVAFAVSWSFHEVDERSERDNERQMNILECTIQTVADRQLRHDRVLVAPILEECTKLEDKK